MSLLWTDHLLGTVRWGICITVMWVMTPSSLVTPMLRRSVSHSPSGSKMDVNITTTMRTSDLEEFFRLAFSIIRTVVFMSTAINININTT